MLCNPSSGITCKKILIVINISPILLLKLPPPPVTSFDPHHGAGSHVAVGQDPLVAVVAGQVPLVAVVQGQLPSADAADDL